MDVSVRKPCRKPTRIARVCILFRLLYCAEILRILWIFQIQTTVILLCLNDYLWNMCGWLDGREICLVTVFTHQQKVSTGLHFFFITAWIIDYIFYPELIQRFLLFDSPRQIKSAVLFDDKDFHDASSFFNVFPRYLSIVYHEFVQFN